MRNDFLTVQKRKIARNLHDFGPYITFRKSAAYLMKPLFESHSRILYRIELSDFPEMSCGHDDDYEFKRIDAGDIDAIAQIERMEEWLTGKVGALLNTGAVCMTAMQEDRVAAFYLANLKEGIVDKLHLVLSLGPSEAFGEQITVHRDYRRKGLATRLRYFFYRYLRERGVASLYGHRAMDNLASEKSAKKYGSRDLAVFRYVRFLNHSRLQYSPVSRQGKPGSDALLYVVADRQSVQCETPTTRRGNTFRFFLSTPELIERCGLSS